MSSSSSSSSSSSAHSVAVNAVQPDESSSSSSSSSSVELVGGSAATALQVAPNWDFLNAMNKYNAGTPPSEYALKSEYTARVAQLSAIEADRERSYAVAHALFGEQSTAASRSFLELFGRPVDSFASRQEYSAFVRTNSVALLRNRHGLRALSRIVTHAWTEKQQMRRALRAIYMKRVREAGAAVRVARDAWKASRRASLDQFRNSLHGQRKMPAHARLHHLESSDSDADDSDDE